MRPFVLIFSKIRIKAVAQKQGRSEKSKEATFAFAYGNANAKGAAAGDANPPIQSAPQSLPLTMEARPVATKLIFSSFAFGLFCFYLAFAL